MKILEEKVESNFDDFVTDLKSLMKIPSVYKKDTSSYPFGKNVDDVLKKMLSISEKLGLKTYYDPDGYYGYAEYGNGKEMVGVLGHLDVVPVGDLKKWNTNPFEPVIIDGKLFGRGAQDDKGPTLAALYAFKSLLDSKTNINKKIRFIFGTDEETLWRGIKQYTKKERIPDYGFTPDANFPLIYAEKGLLQIDLISKNETDIRLKGGDAYNCVPSNISYKCENAQALENALKDLGFEYKREDNKITVIGKTVHAKSADKGINSILRLLIAMNKIGLKSKAIDFVVDNIMEDAFASKIFGECNDKASGNLKFNIGKINIDENKEVLNIDIRIPVSVEKDFVISKLTKIAKKYGFHINETDYLRPVYTPLNSQLVKTLMDSYVEVTQDIKSQAISSGGATYARAMDNCVAFGPSFPYSMDTEHQPNEYIELDEIKKAIKIYSSALTKLLK